MNYLAFDLGAGSGKLFLGRFDGSRLKLENIHRFENGPVSLADGLYWDFLYIFKNMREGILRGARLTGNRITSFGIDSFSNDFSFIDKDGELLSPVRCYRDQRTARCREAVYRKMSPHNLYMASGNQTALFNTLIQLAAMREEKKDMLLDSAHRMMFLPDLLGFYLTGNTASEYTVSSVSQMFDFSCEGWNREVLKAFRIPERLLPPIQRTGNILGETTPGFTSETGVPSFKVVSVCEHDTASAFLASPRKGPCAIISSGTWSLVGTEVEEPIINEFGYLHNIANEGGYPGHHRLLLNVMGTWLLQELRGSYALMGKGYSFADFEALANEESPFKWLIDVDDPLFFSPGDMLNKIRRKCLDNWGSAPETPGQFARCVCESLALKYRWSIEKLEQLTHRDLPVINIVGGGSKDALTCQFTANACGKTVVAGPGDASALGNIMVQMLADGRISSVSEGRELIRCSFQIKGYQPADAAQWEEIYLKFKHMFHLQ